MKTIKKNVAFTTDVNGSVENFVLKFNKTELNKIKNIQKLLKQHSITCAEITYSASKIKADSDFTEGYSCLKLYPEFVVFYVQSKYTSELQYESEVINNNELFN